MSKKALITGITGQDGSYLAEFLLNKKYEVHGIIRRSSSFNTGRIDHIFNQINRHHGDILDGSSLRRIVDEVNPDEIYNLAAQSHVKVSFEEPGYTLNTVTSGLLDLLEIIKTKPHIRLYQASSSEMFGDTHGPQNEKSLFSPQSPYAISKVASYYFVKNYRNAYGLFASNGILFNHESPRRGETFVTRKITRALGRIVCGLQKELILGNINAVRDWGFAGDYVEMMWLMLQQDKPDDYVIATGKAYSVNDFLTEAFGIFNLNWQDYVKIDPIYYRPNEVEFLQGDITKAKTELGWEPKCNFSQLVKMMIDHDYKLAQKEAKELNQMSITTRLKSVACNHL